MGHLLTARRRAFWALYASWYDALWDTPVTRLVAETVTALVPPGMQVVEVGAGTGLITRQLAQSCTVAVAAEPDHAMRKRLTARNLPVGKVDGSAIDELALPAGSWCVVAVNVLHLVDRPSDALSALSELAGPGGCVVVVAPTPHVSVSSVVRANRRRGATLAWAMGFRAAHVVLGPIAAIAGVAGATRALIGRRPVATIDGLQEFHVVETRDTAIARRHSDP